MEKAHRGMFFAHDDKVNDVYLVEAKGTSCLAKICDSILLIS
jgi:hypothetical protein